MRFESATLGASGSALPRDAAELATPRVASYDRHRARAARADPRATRLMQLRGIGEATATALAAMIGDGYELANRRRLAAGLGLTLGQHSSGGRRDLGTSPQATRTCDRFL